MYLELKFHDNDFGFSMVATLEQIWNWIHENNIGVTKNNRTVIEIFQKLEKAGTLKLMIRKLWAIEAHKNQVEFATRGLYWEKVDWSSDKKTLEQPIEDGYDYLNYFDFELEFHKNAKFVEPQNGEHGLLNLINGEAYFF